MLAIKVLIGASIGIVSKLLCDKIEKFLLSKRGLEFSHSKTEEIILNLVMAIMGAIIMWRTYLSVATIYTFLILMICELIAVIDLHHRIIPNQLLLVLLIISLGFGIPDMLGIQGFPKFSILQSVIGLVAGFIIFTLPALASKSVGAGDIKLAATLGFCLGIMDLLYVIVLMGLCVIAYMIAQSRMPIRSMIHSMIPMGPFIVVATLIVISFN